MATPNDPLPPEVREALARGDALEAIRLLRRRTGLGLKEAKDVVDRGGIDDRARFPAAAPMPSALPPAVVAALHHGDKIEAIKLLRTETGLGLKEAKDAIERSPHDLRAIASLPSPGEVPRSPAVVRWLLAVVVVALVVYFVAQATGR
jgi:ribosomal protein L7/L12